MPGKWDGKSRISNDLYRKRHEEIFGKKKMKKKLKPMTPEEEDRNASVIRLADGTVIGLENPKSVGYKDAPKIVVDPKKVKVTKYIIPVGNPNWWSHFCKAQKDILSFKKNVECDWCGKKEEDI